MNKCIVFGIDGLSRTMTEMAIARGKMPHLSRFFKKAFVTPVIPTVPASTPPGWTAIATGAWPSMSGIEGFLVHRAGRRFDERLNATRSGVCTAEFIWETLRAEGKVPLLFKYPVSWPPAGGPGLQVDGAGGWGGVRCHYEIAPYGVWSTDGAVAPANQLAIGTPHQWKNIPPGVALLGEAELSLRPALGGEAVSVHLLIYENDGAKRVAFASARDFSRRDGDAAEGEWTAPMKTLFTIPRGVTQGAWSAKVLELTPGRLRILQTAVHEADGYVFPDDAEADLLEKAGPIEEDLNVDAYLKDGVDAETILDAYRRHAAWNVTALGGLIAAGGWDLVMAHWHLLDWGHHLWWAGWDASHPGHAEARNLRHDVFMDAAYEITDGMFGALLDLVPEGCACAVVGDHGAGAYHTSFLANRLLHNAGLLRVKTGGDGKPSVDWSATKAYSTGVHVYFNIDGRDPEGVVNPADSEALAGNIRELFHNVRDPLTGHSPIHRLIPKSEAAPLGLWGEGVGDLIMTLKEGYQNRNYLPEGAGEVPLFHRQEVGREFTAEHNCFDPSLLSLHTLFAVAGSGIKRGASQEARPIVDIAPTIARILGIRSPRDAQGSAIEELFA